MDSSCKSCDGAPPGDPGNAGLCDACLAESYPLIEAARGKKWSPLSVGMLSVLCDVMFIPSILAVVRGWLELKEVSRREAAGVWRAEHPRIRTGAVWAFVLGGLRPGLVVAVVMSAGFQAPSATRAPERIGSVDELAEVLELVQGDDEEAMLLALEHFDELAPTLNQAQVQHSLMYVQRSIESGEAFRSEIVRSLIDADRVSLADVQRFYPRLDSHVQLAVLELALRPGTEEGVEAMLTLLEEVPPAAPYFVPQQRLIELPEHAPYYLPRLAAPGSSPHARTAAMFLARELCAAGVAHGAFAPISEALVSDCTQADQALAQVNDPRVDSPFVARAEAAASLRVLGCVDADVAAPILRRASSSSDPEIAVAAVDAMLRRGDPVPSSVLTRLATPIESRWKLYVALARESATRRMPPSTRSSQALAEAFIYTQRFGGEPVVEHYALETRVHGDTMMHVHIYRFTLSDDEIVYGAVGPFARDNANGIVIRWNDGSPFVESLRTELVDSVMQSLLAEASQ